MAFSFCASSLIITIAGVVRDLFSSPGSGAAEKGGREGGREGGCAGR